MAKSVPSDLREVLGRCLDIADQLITDGREEEALRYLRDSVLPALDELGRAAMREAMLPFGHVPSRH